MTSPYSEMQMLDAGMLLPGHPSADSDSPHYYFHPQTKDIRQAMHAFAAVNLLNGGYAGPMTLSQAQTLAFGG